MTFVDELRDVTIVQSAGDKENEIIDHVRVGEIIQKRRQGLNGLSAYKLEFVDKLLGGMLSYGLGGEGSRFVLKKIPIIGGLCDGLKGSEVMLDCGLIAVITDDGAWHMLCRIFQRAPNKLIRK